MGNKLPLPSLRSGLSQAQACLGLVASARPPPGVLHPATSSAKENPLDLTIQRVINLAEEEGFEPTPMFIG